MRVDVGKMIKDFASVKLLIFDKISFLLLDNVQIAGEAP